MIPEVTRIHLTLQYTMLFGQQFEYFTNPHGLRNKSHWK